MSALRLIAQKKRGGQVQSTVEVIWKHITHRDRVKMGSKACDGPRSLQHEVEEKLNYSTEAINDS